MQQGDGMKKEEPMDDFTRSNDAKAAVKKETSDNSPHPLKKEELVQDPQNWKEEWGRMDAKLRMKKLVRLYFSKGFKSAFS
jgi:hypothetical protein